MKNIDTPSLLFRPDIARRNLDRMLSRCASAGIGLRPHFKTHQSHAVGRLFRAAGIDKIAVSSLRMAEYFALDGWRDITIAIPLNLREKARIAALAGRLSLGLTLDHVETAKSLAAGLGAAVRIWIEVDTGDHRTGIPWTDEERIAELTLFLAECPAFEFAGVLAHAGHSYGLEGAGEADALYREQAEKLSRVAGVVAAATGRPCPAISFGDTPLCSMADRLEGITEARPGNFIFYDLMQAGIGSCVIDDIAVAMACPVISKSEERMELVVHGGGVHFSKDFLKAPGGRGRLYGQAVRPVANGWGLIEGVYLRALSQEHGVVALPDRDALRQYAHGDLLCFLPVHSCMAADAMGEYLVWENGLAGDRLAMMPKRGPL